MRKAFAGGVGLVLLAVAVHASAAGAAEIKVLSTGNMVSILTEVTGEFERTSGHKLKIEYGSTTRMKSRIEADEAADLTINERFVLEDLLRQARIAGGSIVDIARSPLGIGIRAGAPRPDVSSADALKRALLAAESSIAEELKPRIKLTMGGDAAAQAVASGAAAIGVAQRRNFISLGGVQLLEPLPDLPGIKFLMVAGVLGRAREPSAAMALARFLSSPALAPVIRAKGMEPYM